MLVLLLLYAPERELPFSCHYYMRDAHYAMFAPCFDMSAFDI